MIIMRLTRFLVLSTTSLLVGCTVGSDYLRPEIAGASAPWSTAQSQLPVDLDPWRRLGDPLLVTLIDEAMAANRDIAASDARLREARAMRDVAQGGGGPDVAVTTSAQRRRLSRDGEFPFAKLPGLENEFSLFDGGFDAAWEIDLWGARRRSIEGATARTAAAVASTIELRLRVVAEVTRAYARMRGAQAKVAILELQAADHAQLIELSRQLFVSGEAGRDPLRNAEVGLNQISSDLVGARLDVTEAMNVLAILLAQPPERVRARLSSPAALPNLPEMVGVGLRSDVLRRRPDVAIAEAELASATADVGVATAQLFPQFSLLGGLGLQSRQPGDLVDGGDSLRFGIGPSLRWPIFSRGRIKGQIRAANARTDAALARYENAVITALAESETMINRYNTALEVAHQSRTTETQMKDLALDAERRFIAGEAARPSLLEARSRYHASSIAARDAEAQALIAYAMLYKALGVGYSPSSTNMLRQVTKGTLRP